MKNPIRPALAASLLALAPLGAEAVPARTADRPAPTIESIQALAGDWYEVGEDGALAETPTVTYRLTSAGTAVVSTIFPGQEEEMLTVFHQDGGDLVATHYCMVGNQPTYLARNGEKVGDLVFECRGVTNAESEDDAHMHHGRFLFDGPDRMRSVWQMTENGAVVYTADHTLVRKPSH